MKSPILDASGRPYQRSISTLNWSQIEAAFRMSNGGVGGGLSEPAKLVSAYYSCVVQIAQAFATLPGKLWKPDPGRRGSKPGFKEVYPHRLMRLIDRPHPQMSGMEWRERWAAVLLDQGDVFVLPSDENAPDGLPRALEIYGRDRVSPIRDAPGSPLMGWLLRGRTSADTRTLGLDEVLHWRLTNPYDDVMGLAPKDSLRMALDADFARSVYDKSFYQNGANPSAILKFKQGELDEMQREEVRKTWEEYHQGPSRAGRVAVVGGDWDFTVWSATHSMSQFIEARKLSREEIAAAFFGFPVEFLNAQENGGLSRAGEEMARLKLYENCIFPMARRFEPEFNYGLIERYDRRGVLMAFDTRQVPVALTYAKTESEIFERYVKNGVPVNQIIQVLDLSFDPVAGGDVGLVPDNLVPINRIEEIAEAAVEKSESPESEPDMDDEDEDDDDDDDETPATSEAARVTPLIARLREKTKRILYGIRQAAMRQPGIAGASEKQWREWTRLTLPIMASAVQMGATPTMAAPSKRDLDTLQQYAEQIALPRGLETVCRDHTKRLLMAFHGALREAGATQNPGQFCGHLDRTAKQIAERAVMLALAAGRAAVSEEEEAG